MSKLLFKTAAMILIIPVFIFSACNEKKPAGLLDKKIETYNRYAKVKPVFVPLVPGAVTPDGWLRDWAMDAANGITGHLDEYTATFREGWKSHGFEAMGANKEDGTGWPLEQCSYWLDGAVRLAYILNDSALIRKTSSRLDMVVEGVLKGGESFIYWKPRDILSESAAYLGWVGFNNWAHSQMGRALVAYYQASKNEKILQALVKVYRNYPLANLTEEFNSVSGACNLDAMTETYLLTGDSIIHDSIIAFSERIKYKTIAGNWLHDKITPGHDVVYYEDIRVPSLLYSWTGNQNDLDATRHAIEWGEKLFLLPPGVCSGEEFHAGIGSTRNIETCNVPASMWTFIWMLRLTGDNSFADRIEKIFFNAGPAPISRDYSTMCYYQSPNRYSSKVPGEEPLCPGKDAYKYTKIGHPVLCCVGNSCRLIPSYIMHMWMASMDQGLAATLYGPCKVNSTVGEKNTAVEIVCQTSYPFEENISMTINPESKVEFPLYLRIPEWCSNPEITINGTAEEVKKDENSFVKISRTWKKNDNVVLHFPMQVKVVKGNETPYPQIDYFNKYHKMAKDTAINSPYECVLYGPLLFSLAIPDENPNREKPGAKYNYALDVDQDSIANQVSVTRDSMPGHWSWPLNAPLKISVKASEFDWTPTENLPLPKETIKDGIEARISLIPYGCTKFRVTMFPVTADAWNK